MNSTDYRRAHAHIESMMREIPREPDGAITHPYLAISTGTYYRRLLFCWDNYFSALRFAADGETRHLRNFLDNMFSFQRGDGFIPCAILADGGSGAFDPSFCCQPFLGQAAAQLLRLTGDRSAAAADLPKLQKFIDHWFAAYAAPHGLCRWGAGYMSGIDNEISGAIMHPATLVAPDLNAWLYLELRSAGFIASEVGDAAAAAGFRARAESLKRAINEHLWSETIGAYGTYDLSSGRVRISLGDTDHISGVGAFAFLSSSALPVLYAGAATPERASRMIREYVLSPDHFRSPFGIRSLSRSSEYCNYAVLGNPGRFDPYERSCQSNWQGPVWIPLGWMVFHALLRYGFRDEAAALSDDTIKLICNSLDVLGSLSENVDGDTGRPLYAANYASWNLLGDLMARYLDDTQRPPELFF